MIDGKTIVALASAILISLGVIFTTLLEHETHIDTYSGSFTVVIESRGSWNFKYVWLNLNSTPLEEALKIVGKYENILYEANSSRVPVSIYGEEEYMIMFTDPPHNPTKIIGLNITGLKPDNAVLALEMICPDGEKLRLAEVIHWNTLPKYFYTKVLESGTYIIRIVNNVEIPVRLTLNMGEGIMTVKRPYIRQGIAAIVTGMLLMPFGIITTRGNRRI